MNHDILYRSIMNGGGNADMGVYRDAVSSLELWAQEEANRAPEWHMPRLLIRRAHELRDRMQMELSGGRLASGELELLYSYYRRVLFLTAPYWFDDFMQAVEFDRKAEKKFYLPRRHYLKPMVEGYQKILDGELRLLTISMPKRAGKSQTELNFVLLLSGRNPEGATLMEGAGDALVKSFYNGCLEYLQSGNEYNFYEIFPEAQMVQTNADLKTVNLKNKARFPTIMCRSIDSTQVGLSEASNALILDDCVEGREEAKNIPRLDAKWEVISGDVMGRAIEGTPIISTGTRYSLRDPIGRLQEYAATQSWPWKAVEVPALDLKTDESNYEYVREGRKVFTTQYFREQRDLLSAEQWESEFQQQPFEAKGLLFPKDSLNYFFELPADRSPDSVIAVADTAESGSDSTSMPIAALYGDDVYIIDVVFDDRPSEITKPECAHAIAENKVVNATFESNNAGMYFARDVEQLLKEAGYRCGVRTKRTVSNKQTRIEFASDNIIRHFWFRDWSTLKRGGQYWNFLREVTTYTRSGKVPHDDAPDSLSLMENELRGLMGAKVETFQRPF